MNGIVKYSSVHVKIQHDKIFNFIIKTGLQNIFEFIKYIDFENKKASTAQFKLEQQIVFNFFPHIEKFRNNVEKIQDLMVEMDIPVQILSNKNQISTLEGIKDYLTDTKGRNIFLSECIDLSNNVLAETRNIRNILFDDKNSHSKKTEEEKSINEKCVRRLLSIKHDLSMWKFVIHVLSLINLSASAFTPINEKKKDNKNNSTTSSSSSNNNGSNFSSSNDNRSDEAEENDDGANETSKDNISKKDNLVYYECNLLFLKANEYQASKYFQSYNDIKNSRNNNNYNGAAAYDDEKIFFSEPQQYKEDNEHLLTPIEYYITDSKYYGKSKNDGKDTKVKIPSIFSNYFFNTSDGKNNNSKVYNKSRQKQANDAFYSNNSKKNNNNERQYGGYSDDQNYSDDMLDYSSLGDNNVNNTSFHDVNVVALSDSD
jgi:hypothetical protein